MKDLTEKLRDAFGEEYFLGVLHDSSDARHFVKASALTASLNLNDLRDNWVLVPESEVLPTLRDMLYKSLAYTSGRKMAEADAIFLANQLLAMVSGPKSCYVNFQRRGEHIRVSNSLTEATFDTGMVIVGNQDQVLFCRSEED